MDSLTGLLDLVFDRDAGWIILQRCWREWLTGIVDGVFDKDAGLPA